MDLAPFIARIRDHYVEQFCAFAKEQRASCTRGASEVKLQLSERSDLFDPLYCVDFITNDGTTRIIELQPGNVLIFDEVAGTLGKASLSIEYLCWDSVLIEHDLDRPPVDDLARWFGRWFDPDDERQDPAAEVSRLVHSMLVQPKSISIDFGTADPEAFWEILQLLEGAGATSIKVRSSRDEATSSS